MYAPESCKEEKVHMLSITWDHLRGHRYVLVHRLQLAILEWRGEKFRGCTSVSILVSLISLFDLQDRLQR